MTRRPFLAALHGSVTRWLDHVAPLDPSWADQEPSQLDRIGSIPSERQVTDAIMAGTTGPAGTVLLMPWQAARAARHVVALFDPAPAGEHGDVDAMRRGLGAA